MSFLNDRYDVFAESMTRFSGHLNEDLSIDDLFTTDDAQSQASVLADDSSVSAEKVDTDAYEHIAISEFKMYTDISTPSRIRRSIIKMFPIYVENNVIPVLDDCRNISSFATGFMLDSLDDFMTVSQVKEYLDRTPNSFTGRRLKFVILFNVKNPTRVRSIFSVLKALFSAHTQLGRYVTVMEYMVIDGWTFEDYRLKGSVIADINDREYSNTKTEKAIKHFVDVFTKSKKTKKELAQYMSPRQNFMHTGREMFYTRVSFLDDTWRNVIFSVSEDPVMTRSPMAFVPEGKTARVRYSYHDTFVRFRVAGTLIFWHRIDTGSRWDNDYKKDIFRLDRLDPEYQHNCIEVEVEFDSYPDIDNPGCKKKIHVDVHNRNIDNLVITAEDKYLEDINHFKQLIELSGTDNVKNIEWQFKEDV